MESLHSTRDYAVHEARRRIWDRGFSVKGHILFPFPITTGFTGPNLLTHSPIALRDYEGRVTQYTYDLMSKFALFSGKSIDASAWFNYYSFDVMGDFAFGKSFNMLQTGSYHYAITWLDSSMTLLGRFTPIAWAVPVGAIAPIIGATFRRFIRFCNAQLDERRVAGSKVPDITSWLLKAAPDVNDLEATKWLHGDSRLIIVAGSDTVAIALTHLFYYLAVNPAQVDKLRKELEPLMRGDEPFTVRNVQNAKHLNAIINETLRMHPPVPSGVFRTTPPQGITVDGTFIPGGVNIVVPFYTIGRCEIPLLLFRFTVLLLLVSTVTDCEQRKSVSRSPTSSSPSGGTTNLTS